MMPEGMVNIVSHTLGFLFDEGKSVSDEYGSHEDTHTGKWHSFHGG